MLEKFFRSDLFVRVMAIFLAVVLWLLVEGDDITRPALVKESFDDVSLVTLDLGEGLVVENMPSEVNVTLEGPQEDLAGISSRDLLAFVDLQGKEPGDYNIPVKVHPPTNLEVVSHTPSQVEVTIDEMDARNFDLEVAMLGRDPAAEVKTTVTPSDVTLKGAASLLERVETVMVYADARRLNQTQTLKSTVVPQPLDEDREPVEQISASPSEIEIILELIEEVEEVEIDEEQEEEGETMP